ncbi:uncharacterized protein LOC120526915 isoform X2 [Polypterus senegalus]|uniref:uncharacterized protein LOC120526915 isoform X2 n=1 Tax=Polypterus senegalus TaxID=55291 RepID=UPI0019662CD0|nr:uncharacterized protein LOC120526915 isoform X2 [Polypterus senegalus]
MILRMVASQLECPIQSLTGWMAKRFLEKKNEILEVNAAKLAQIQPGSTVLEVGFGPGLGLQEALRYLTDPEEGLMVATINMIRMKKVASQGLLLGKMWQPEIYMDALIATGFKDVHIKDKEDRGLMFKAIFATASK